jgi:type IV fimbrial biogenesis protein FimT
MISGHLKQISQTRYETVQHGFTLIELIVTIAIAALLMMVAVPNFVQFQRNAQLSDAVTNFLAAANAARANAMKQGLNTYMIPAVGTNWSSGWMVYADADWDQVFDASEEVVLRHDALASDITITTVGVTGGPNSLVDGYLMFNGSGYPRLKNGSFTNGRIELRNTARSRTIIFDSAGRVRSCVTGSTGC